MPNNEIGLRIKQLRKEREYTLQEVADRLHVSKPTAQRYESGVIKIPIEKVVSLAKMFNVSVSYIMGWKTETIASGTINTKVDTSDKPGGPSLKTEEVALLAAFERLNAEGKEKLFDYIYDLVEIPKYAKIID